MSSESRKNDEPRIVIIGAGVGGLSCAIALKRKHGFHNFHIYEKGGEVGGTWRDNIYPGCSSDVGVAFFSLSSDLHDWKESHGSQEDILEYWVDLAKKYDIYHRISFNHKVTSVEWDDSKNHYQITAEDTLTGKSGNSTAEIVISAIGVLETPRFAQVPGLDTFKGDMFHSARWNYNVDLKGKRVGVVGNGASASQFIPKIAQDTETQIIQFCRSPTWIFPNIRREYSSLKRWTLRNVPFFMRLQRWSVFLTHELLYALMFRNVILRQGLTKLLTLYIQRNAPEKYHDKLIPSFPLGCKRTVFDTGYLQALNQSNIDLNWDGIEKIVEDGILTKKGERIPLDVIIFATGFAADFYPLPVRGRTQTIQEYYEEEKGPKAYLGTAVPGFPNFFMIFGPNTGTGHTSVIFTNEVQIDYILQLTKPILERKILSIEVKKSAAEAYNSKIHSLLNSSVFTSCMSWYRVGGDGKVSTIFPGSGVRFWMLLRKPNWADYFGVGVDRWISKQIFRQRLWRTLQIALLSGLVILAANRPTSLETAYAAAIGFSRDALQDILSKLTSIRGF